MSQLASYGPSDRSPLQISDVRARADTTVALAVPRVTSRGNERKVEAATPQAG